MDQLKPYAHSLSLRICREVFAEKSALGGNEVLSLTPIQQVNYFVLKCLYRSWQQEMLRVESPYFDYKHPSVRQALHRFMNTLSQHISVGEEALAPLLSQAVEDTLCLLLSPQDFFHKELVSSVSMLSATYLRNTKKYLRINVHILEEFLLLFEEEGVDEISSARSDDLLSICEKSFDRAEDPRAYLSKFDLLFPLPEGLGDSLTDTRSRDYESSGTSKVEPEAPSSHSSVVDPSEEAETYPSADSFEESEKAETYPSADSFEESEEAETYPSADSFEESEKAETYPSADSFEESEKAETYPSADSFEESEKAETYPSADSFEESEKAETYPSADPFEESEKDTHFPQQEPEEDTHFPQQQVPEQDTRLSQNPLKGSEKNTKLPPKPFKVSKKEEASFIDVLFHNKRALYLQVIQELSSYSTFDEAIEMLLQRYGKPQGWDLGSTEAKAFFRSVYMYFR